MGAARRRVLTHTGECSAPAGLAGCCRRTGRAVLVRCWGAHASGTRALGYQGPSPRGARAVQESLPQPLSCLHVTPGPPKAVSGSCPSSSWYLGSLPVVPGEQGLCCLGTASQLCGRLLAAPISADVDECSLEYSPCSQLCSNTPGAFSCACLQGYILRHGTACEVAGRVRRGARAV